MTNAVRLSILNAMSGPCEPRVRRMTLRWIRRIGGIVMLCLLVAGGLLLAWQMAANRDAKKHYWATSLASTVDNGLLQGLTEAVERGEIGWLDVNPKVPLPLMTGGINLILYHVGGNCYIGRDCDRFPASEPTGDRWGDTERSIDLNDARTRKIVIADLVGIVQRGHRLAGNGAIVGVHIDNVHKLDADGLAQLLNDYGRAIEVAKQQGLIAKTRATGYIAKNNPLAVRTALDRGLLYAAPLYQINENATLNQFGVLDSSSRVARRIGRRYGIPVFLKAFGTDVAYAVTQSGHSTTVMVSSEMTRRMAKVAHIAGAAWSADEASYRPTLFAQGAPVPAVLFPYRNRRVASHQGTRVFTQDASP